MMSIAAASQETQRAPSADRHPLQDHEEICVTPKRIRVHDVSFLGSCAVGVPPLPTQRLNIVNNDQSESAGRNRAADWH